MIAFTHQKMASACSSPSLTTLLDDLPPELVLQVAEALHPDDALAVALSCRTLWRASTAPPRHTRYDAALFSVNRLLWALNSGLKLSHKLAERASALGKLELLRALYGLDASIFDHSTKDAAARHGCIEVLEWLAEMGIESEFAANEAAKYGQIEALKWLHERGSILTAAVCISAACGGQLEALRYAHSNGAPLDDMVCYDAARGGHREVLRYAHSNGCSWVAEVCFQAGFTSWSGQ